MIILFEEHQYAPELLQDIYKDVTGLEQDIVTKKISLGYVGYFFSPEANDCVFILPKVLLEDDDNLKTEVLANIKWQDEENKEEHPVMPEDIITPEGQEKYLDKEYRKFIYEFSVWVYRSINMYRTQNKDAKSIYYKPVTTAGQGKKHKARTMLDVILSLIRFNKENQNFFLFVLKNMHSGMNKINWTRTISHSQAFVQNGSPIYLNPVNKKRQINFDEELFIIFFSILHYLNEQYGFKAPINCQYDLITGSRFENYRKSLGKKRLLQIKYKYFSDKALELWDLCYAFFNSSHIISVNTQQQDYLLAKSFEHVFEAMIDELIGDSNIPKGLKEQDDGKRVDHMYAYDALTRSDEDQTDEQIYYIGDSKYYKSGHRLGRESIYKQYTYARNVVQWNIDLFMRDELATRDMSDEEKEDYRSDKNNSKFKQIQLRKDGGEKAYNMEGYAVIPNFFLSAYVEKDRKYISEPNIRIHEKTTGEHATYISCQFENRLFDRDTLILSHYDVNFLYIIYLYARNKSSEKLAWRSEVRRIFRDEIREVLRQRYDFFALTPLAQGSDEQYLEKNFHKLLGKVFTPYDDARYYALALEKNNDKKSGSDLREELEQYFFVTPCDLGHDPDLAMQTRYGADYLSDSAPTFKLAQTTDDEVMLVGCVKSQAHWEWVKGGYYNIRLQGCDERNGALPRTKEMMLVSRVMLYLYNKTDQPDPQYLGIFDLQDPNSVPNEYVLSRENPNIRTPYPVGNNPDQHYMVYEIEIDPDSWQLPPQNDSIATWLKEMVSEQSVKGSARFFKSGELKRIIKPNTIIKTQHYV